MKPSSMRTAAAILLATTLAAQDATEPVFRAETRLMQIEVRVRDRDGAPVRGLTAADFSLTEDGEPQSIVSADFVPAPSPLPPITSSDGAPQGPEPQQASRQTASSEAKEQAGNAPRLWVYIANQSRDQDYLEGLDAIEGFIRNEMAEGMAVSIGGTRFTTNRRALLRVTELMRQNPNGLGRGPEGEPVPKSIDMLVEQHVELELIRETTPDIASNTNPMSNSLMPIDQKIQLNNRMALFQMLALVRQLSAYPGKKAVLLFRGGLRWDNDNSYVADLLTGEATRHRISFYTMDSRGLEPILPVADSTIYGTAFRKLKRGALHKERLDRIQGSQHGLRVLAESTGGAAVVNSNDYGLAFRKLVSDSGDYYLLSYRPANDRQEGLLRRIRVRMDRDDVEVTYSRRYYEQKPFDQMSKGERSVHLYRALEFDSEPTRLHLRFDGHFFRDHDERTTFVYSAAVHPSELQARAGESIREVAYSIAAKVTPVPVATPIYGEISSREKFEAERFDQSLADPNAFVQHGHQVGLEPGRYEWRIAWRDDTSAQVGRFVTALDVPDLTRPSSASSLLVTRRASPIEDGAEAGLLDVGGMRLEPESPHELRAGDRLYLLYDLYEVPAKFLDAPPPMRLAMTLGENPVEISASSQVFVAAERRSLRYLAVLDTSSFELGGYTAVALLPDSEARPDPYLHSSFRIIE